MIDQKTARLTAFIRICNQADGICQAYAKAHGLSGTAFYILYSLAAGDAVYTQKALCEAWGYPRQTVNAALKTLQRQGLVALRFSPGNRKSKEIYLTEAGLRVTRAVIEPFLEEDRKAFSSLDDAECAALISALEKYKGRLVAGLARRAME